MIPARMTGDITWKSEFYFLTSVMKQPRYVFSVPKPHLLFANAELMSLWRMVEQAVSRRGEDDPMMDALDYDELTLTGEYQRNNKVDVESLWRQSKESLIAGAPEKFHRLLELYSACRILDQKVCARLDQLVDSEVCPEEILTGLQRDVISIHKSTNYKPGRMGEIAKRIWDDRGSNPHASLVTGFNKMDDTIGALVPGCTYLWAARTSHGKSSWAAQVINNQAKAGNRVGVIGLEDSKSVWASRWLSKVSGVDLKKIRDNVLSSQAANGSRLDTMEQLAIDRAVGSAHLDNIHLADAKGAQLTDVMRLMNDLVVRLGCEIIWVDYLQAIYSDRADQRNRRDFLEYAWAMMEREAERLQVPLMITAQLNRAWETEELPAMPSLRHVEYMGAAEQKCYVGAIIYRPFKDFRLDKDERDDRFGEMLIHIEKSKQGESVALKYEFDPKACVIREA